MNVNLLKFFSKRMKSKHWILMIILLAIANCFLYNPFQLYFLNDDFLHIPLTANGVLFQQRSIRPIHELLVRLDLLLWNKQAFGFHLTALILHFIVAIELFFVAKIIFEKLFQNNEAQSIQLSYFSVALFLCYPQHAESLAWILGRTPVLATIFFLPVVILFFNESKSWKTYTIAFILYLLTLFTYEQSVLFPVILFLLILMEKDTPKRKEKIAFVVIITVATLFYIIARKLITTEIAGKYEAGNFTSFQLTALLNNLYKFVARLMLNPINQPKVFFIYSVLFLLAVAIVFAWQRKKILQLPVIVILLSIAILLLPVVSLGITIRSYESGRYLYQPSIFLAILLAYLFSLIKNNYLKLSLIIVLVIYWGIGKIDSAQDFKQASAYAKTVQTQIQTKFLQDKEENIEIDTLHVTIKRLPVYRMGLKTGALWLNPSLDTNKLKTAYIFDEFEEK